MVPLDLLHRIISLFPDFQQQWCSADNCFKNDDGSFTYCGVFSEFSSLVRDRYESLTPSAMAGLGDLLSECMNVSNPSLHEAAATCFLENLAYEPFSPSLAKYLSGEPLRFFSQFSD